MTIPTIRTPLCDLLDIEHPVFLACDPESGRPIGKVQRRSVYEHGRRGDLDRTLGDELASSFQVGNLRRGVLQVYARDSVTLQEMNFQKRVILRQLKQRMPQSDVSDLRFRIHAS